MGSGSGLSVDPAGSVGSELASPAAPPPPWSGQDRRRFPRVALSVPVMIHIGGRKLYARSLDCSMGGAAVFLNSPLEVSPVPMRLSIEHEGYSVEVRARVRHCTVREPGYSVGFEFLGLGSRDEQLLESLVAGQDRRSSVRLPVAIQVKYRGMARQEVYHLSESTDVSCGGVRFELSSEMVLGERIDLQLVFEKQRIARVGTAVRIDRSGDRQFAAICFDPVSRVQEEELTKACLGQLKG